MDGNLCDLCQQINLYTLGAYVHDHFDSKRPRIERTADQLSHDCPLCRLFLHPGTSDDAPAQQIKSVSIEAFQALEDDDAGTFWFYLTAWLRSWKPKSQGIEYYPLSKITVSVVGEQFDFGIPYTLDVLADQESDDAKRYVGGRIVPATNSDTSLHHVSDWLAECLEGHSLCRVGVSGRKFINDPTLAPLPDRVIHVGDPTVSVEPHLLLTSARRGRYTALSYCWEPMEDGKLPFRLLSSNLLSLQERLPLAELPASIRDAIDFTRRLGISYIWIDRLCIIQDDDDDWKGHAAQMRNIYEGAVLTIAAVAAKTRDEGLYFTPPERPSVRIKCATHEKEVGHMRIARCFDPGPDFADDVRWASSAIDTELGMSKWNTRGWVMQERLMSRRIVYFGRTQILWECQQMTRKQDGIAGDVGKMAQKSSLYSEFRFDRLRTRLLAILPFVVANPPQPDFWYQIIQDYTSRDLTYPDKDKEKAMAGVADAVRLRLRMSKYAYGIFLERADQMLLWYAKSVLRAPETARAPSWSWMAYDGKVRILKPKSESWTRGFGQCAFLEGDRTTAQLPTGTPRNAEIPHLPASILHVRGACVVRMIWEAETSDNTTQIQEWLEEALGVYGGESHSGPEMYLPKLIFKAVESQSGRLVLCMGATDRICGTVNLDTGDHDLLGKEITCLIVGEETAKGPWLWRSDETTQKKTYHLLVMVEVEPSSRDTGPAASIMYRRVGVAQALCGGGLGFPVHKEAKRGDILIV